MGDLSNKTLALLVGVAIVVSLVGLLSAPKGAVITGGVTSGPGTASVNITGTVAINLSDNSIDFGSGYVDPSGPGSFDGTYAHLNSSVVYSPTTSGWYNTSAPWTTKDNFTIENIGQVVVNLTINASQNVSSWLSTASGTEFKLQHVEVESGACGNGATLASSWTNITTNEISVCTGPPNSGFLPADANDTIAAYAFLNIPISANAGPKSVTITYIAVDNSN